MALYQTWTDLIGRPPTRLTWIRETAANGREVTFPWLTWDVNESIVKGNLRYWQG